MSPKHRFFLLSLFASDVWSLCTTTLGSFTSETINGLIDSLQLFRELTGADIGWPETHTHHVWACVGLIFVDSQATAIGRKRAELIDGESGLSRQSSELERQLADVRKELASVMAELADSQAREAQLGQMRIYFDVVDQGRLAMH